MTSCAQTLLHHKRKSTHCKDLKWVSHLTLQQLTGEPAALNVFQLVSLLLSCNPTNITPTDWISLDSLLSTEINLFCLWLKASIYNVLLSRKKGQDRKGKYSLASHADYTWVVTVCELFPQQLSPKFQFFQDYTAVHDFCDSESLFKPSTH